MSDQAGELPHNYEAEQALLGAILITGAAYDRVAAFLREEHFYAPVHGRIYAACRRLIESGKKADITTLRSQFQQDGDLADIGGAQYLARLTASATTVICAGDYGQAILETWKRRCLILVSRETIQAAYDLSGETTADDVAQETARVLDDVLDGSDDSGLLPIGAAVDRSMQLSERAAETPDGIFGMPLGLIDLDRKLGGLEPDQLVIVEARPGMGKTAFATSVAFNVARGNTPVAFFSHEMSNVQLTNRLLSHVSGVPLLTIKSGRTDAEQKRAMQDAARYLKTLPLCIDDSAGQSPSAIRAKARRFKRRNGLGLAIVDHIQIMRGDARVYQNRTAEITDISRALKVSAKDLQVPIIALSQLSRAVEQREDKRPMLSDLRESGSIEQDADIVAFLYREEYYHRRTEPDPKNRDEHVKWEADLFAMRGMAEILIEKGRDIETGKVDVFFDGERLAYKNLVKQTYMQGQAA